MGHFKIGKVDLGGVLEHAPEIFFYIAVFLWLTVSVTDTSMLAKWMMEGPITDAFVVHRVPLLIGAAEIIRIWRGEYGRRDAVGLAICIVMGYSSWLLGRDASVWAILIIFCARNLNLKRVCGLSAAYVTIIVVIIIALSQLGVLPDYILEQGRGGRHCLGFTYCLYPGQYLFIATLALCWLRGRRFTVWEALLVVAVHVWVYAMTISRLSFGLSLVAVAFTLIYKWDKQSRIPWIRISRFMRWVFPITVLVAIVLTVLYLAAGSSPFMAWLNRLAGARIRFQSEGVRDFGMPLFGQDVSFVGNGFGLDGPPKEEPVGYNFVDNLFFHTAIRYGLVFAVGYALLYTLTAFDAHREGDVLLVAMIALIALHCTLDNLAMWLHYNVLLFTIASLGKENSVIWFRRGTT